MTTLSTPQRFLVIHKQKRETMPIYFGPFVSERLADEFIKADLGDEGINYVRPLLPRQNANL